MSDQKQKPFDDATMPQRDFSQWEDEGGALESGRENGSIPTTIKRKIHIRVVNYDEKDEGSGSTSEHVATDETMEKKFGTIQNAYEEGFASADGVRGGTAETDGRVRHPEKGDDTRPNRTLESLENENPGLADN